MEHRQKFLKGRRQKQLEKELDGYVEWICKAGMLFGLLLLILHVYILYIKLVWKKDFLKEHVTTHQYFLLGSLSTSTYKK